MKLLLWGGFQCYPLPIRKKGGNGWKMTKQEDFSSFVIENGLIDIPFKQGEFTWNNKRLGFVNISEKLDSFLLGGD